MRFGNWAIPFFLILSLQTAPCQTQLINHVTRAEGGFKTEVMLENRVDRSLAVSIIPFQDNGTVLPTTHLDLQPNSLMSFHVDQLFGTESVSHFEISSRIVQVSVAYRAATGPSSPAHVYADTRVAKRWRVFPGDWNVVFDGLAIVNKGERPTDVSVVQLNSDGVIIHEEVVAQHLQPRAKTLYVLGSPEGSAFSPCSESYFDVSAHQDLAVTALRGTPPNAAVGYLWQNQARPLPARWNPAVGINKFDLFMQYLGSASGGDQGGAYQHVTRAMAKKAITDAANRGIPYFRVAVAGYYPQDLDLWQSDPARFWALMDDMMVDLRTHDIKIIPVFFWLLYQFPIIADETIRHMFLDVDSQSHRLARQYVAEFITRYRDHDRILFYELTNELNLIADLDMVARTPWEPSVENITTDEMIVFTKEIADLIRGLDPTRRISSGHSTPRPFAAHLRAQPEFARGGGDYTEDSLAEFRQYLTDIHENLDIVSVHLYNAGTHERFGVTGRYSADLLDIIKSETDAMGKILFLGEYGDVDPTISENAYAPFSTNVLIKTIDLDIPYSAPWAWQIYLNGLNQPNEFNIEPGYTDGFLGTLRDANVALGNPQTAHTLPDRIAPQVIMTQPLSSSILERPIQRLFAVASDDIGIVTHVDFSVDGDRVGRVLNPPYTIDFDTGNLPPGTVIIRATAFDAAGNQSFWETEVTSGTP